VDCASVAKRILAGTSATGTVLACMAVLAGVPSGEATSWVMANYDSAAIETDQQEEFVRSFADL
jgi:hypothetical protein